MDAKTIRTQLIDLMVALKHEAAIFTAAPTANYTHRRFLCGLMVTLHTHETGDRIALYQEMPERLERIRRNPSNDALLMFGTAKDFKLIRSGPFNIRQLKFISEYVASDIEEAQVPIEDERIGRELFGGCLFD